MSSGWLPKHRQLLFQIFEEGPKPTFSHVPSSGLSHAFRTLRETTHGRFSKESYELLKLIDDAPLDEACSYIYQGLHSQIGSASEGSSFLVSSAKIS